MPTPTIITIPHSLGRAEVKRRMADRIGELPGRIPGGVATVTSSWPQPDTMAIDVALLGKQVTATVDVEESTLRISLALPPSLSFLSGIIAAAVRERGQNVLLDDKSGR